MLDKHCLLGDELRKAVVMGKMRLGCHTGCAGGETGTAWGVRGKWLFGSGASSVTLNSCV